MKQTTALRPRISFFAREKTVQVKNCLATSGLAALNVNNTC